jgi:hypothetical protein
MNQIHILAEFLPFGEFHRRPYLTFSSGGRLPGNAREVNTMAFFLSIYTAVLVLAIWQESHDAEGTHGADKKS